MCHVMSCSMITCMAVLKYGEIDNNDHDDD